MQHESPFPTAMRDVPDSVGTALRDFYRELPRQSRLAPFSLVRTVQQMHSPTGLRDGFERELLGAFAVAQGRHYDPHRVSIPLPLLSAQRDLTAGTASAGGYLIGEEQARVVDLLRGWSIVVDGGAQVVPMASGNLAVPRNGGDASTYWLATESTAIGESNPVTGEVVLSPKMVGVYTEFSHKLSVTSPQLEFFLRQNLVGAVGQALDLAVFNGSGTSGQPLGLFNTPGVGIVSGTSLDWAGVRTIRKSAIAAGARESNLMFVGGADVQDLLAGRERIAGGGLPIWNDSGNVSGIRAVATNRIPATAICCGDFSQVALPIWGGVELEINPFANFHAGIKGARVLIGADVGCLNPGAFSLATAVT